MSSEELFARMDASVESYSEGCKAVTRVVAARRQRAAKAAAARRKNLSRQEKKRMARRSVGPHGRMSGHFNV